MKSNQVHSERNHENRNSRRTSVNKTPKILYYTIGVGIVLIAITIALSATTLAIVVSRLKETTTVATTSTTAAAITTTPAAMITTTIATTTTTLGPSLGSQLAEAIKTADVMMHLNALQQLATESNGTRAINTIGFNRTLDYISNYLKMNTNFIVNTAYFYLKNFILGSNPILLTSINGTITNRTFSLNLATAEFVFMRYTKAANFSSYILISPIPNLGCSDADWISASPSPNGQVALVKRGDCTFIDKAAFALKYNATALLIYNDGTAPDRLQPVNINLGEGNQLPGLSLSYNLGQELASAAQDPLNDVGVRIIINVADESTYPVGNICADTPTGDATQTIVVGSHSDSVPAGPGINDNGSGSAANLGLAIALARLFKTPTYEKYKYRIRFCWWGAEEVGLLGSDFHVKQAKNSSVVGERLTDYLVNLNYDMLGSPNYMFGIYDGRTANTNTPPVALPGSNKMTDLYRSWFDQQKLPWNYTDFSGRSDYGPFLAEGIVAGGLFSGADGLKTKEERDYYDKMLGQGMGGIAGAIHDPCYHRACDSMANINEFAYGKMVQAAAYVLEFLARQDELRQWLYPSTEIQRINTQKRQRYEYNSINEYFGLPYF